MTMSRICVKNLPEYLTLNRLKEHFSQKGELTDAKLIHTREGKSRKIAFIGYRTEQEAEEAIKYFNNSYLDTSRITCEVVWKDGDPNFPRPWSRYSKEKKKLTLKKSLVCGRNEKSAVKTNEIDDPKLQEFLHVMQPRSKLKLWADDLVVPTSNQICKASEKCAESKQEYQKKSIKELKVNKSSSKEDRMHDENPRCSPQDADEVLQTGRLYVHNLHYAATEEELAEFFNEVGNVKEVHLVIDKETKRSKGFGYVVYSSPEDAARALKKLDHSIFQGRILHVVPAKTKDLQNLENHVSEGKGKTYKQQRAEKRKALEADGHTRAWNSLFMRADTIVDNIARKYGVGKSDLLDCEADDLAVSIALGETHIIAETKKALMNAGVNVSSLEEFGSGKSEGEKRSNHVLLVKNLPFSTSEGELAKMFGKFGSLDKIILPSTRTLALVVFLEPAEARTAFNRLCYKRYSDTLLYLEWAPSNIFSQDPAPIDDSKRNMVGGNQEAKKVLLEVQAEGIAQAEIDPDRVESRTLYIMNLSFKTTEENLGKHIRENMKEGKILSIRILEHFKEGKNVSRGCGFVEFDSMETANNVFRALQGTYLDGHALNLQPCHGKKDKFVLKKAEIDQSSTKLIVRNVAFEATKKDLRLLFSPFGQVKSLRLPKRFGKHRGFAFVEYVTKQEAQNALKALSSTHLYGRHLVLEKAKVGETLEELRARTAAQFANDGGRIQDPTNISKKRKIAVVSD